VKILKACPINYDERTDVREQHGALGADDVDWLQIGLDTGEVRIEPGLRGWPPYNATAFTKAGVFHVEVEGLEETPTTPDNKRNAGREPRPAIVTIAALFVTCPSCSTDIPLATPDGDTVDWPLACIEDPEETPAQCPECGQGVTIRLPKSLPVNP
jgi:hypothetical protein